MVATRSGAGKTTEETNGKVGENIKDSNFDSYRNLIRESVNGYVFWCLIQSLAPMIWFYPLNELEISGYEVFAGLWFIQIFAGVPLIWNFIKNQKTLLVLRGLSVLSLASFQMATTFDRLAVLACGNGIVMLVLTASLWNPCQRIRSMTSWGLLLGFMAFVTSRVWFVSFVPTWWTNQSNSVVVAIGMVAVVDQFISGFDHPGEPDSRSSKPVQRPSCITMGVGFGSLLYLFTWIFGECSIIMRWTVGSYPDVGPHPLTGGAGILLALCCGVYLSGCRHVATSKIWWLIGTLAFGALYYLPTWQGYCGGLMLAVYGPSIWPEMTDRVSRCPPARTLFIAILTYMLQNFFLVWTVAYNFVPLGVYTREHTDILIIWVMGGIGVGMFVGGSTKDEAYTSYINVTKKEKLPSSKFNTLLVFITVVGLLGFGARYNPTRYDHPVKTSPKILTSAIWTYHFGYDNKGWPSLERTASLLNDSGADVITMLESDASKPFLGNNDLGMWLEEKMGYYVDFGPSTKDHTWGNMFLSKYPIVKSKHHLLPSPDGELAPGVTATVNVSGSLVDFVVCHMGNDRDRLDRKLQAEFLADELRNSENPVIFMAYVTSKPGSKEYKQLINAGNMKDIDETDLKRFCEYIMYRGLKRLGYARITHGGLSDTEVQMARFEIVDDPTDYKDNSRVKFGNDESLVISDEIRFNPKFGTVHHGHGWFKEHRFHMSTPKYFVP